MTDCRSLLAHNLKRCREILGLSQMALAEKVGCSTTLIGNIEIKKRFPSAENIDRIARALKVPVSDLFAEKEPETIKALVSAEELKSRLEQKILNAIGEALGD
jgi:transcriptional regulator with XRE-family HTH domain